MNDLEFYEKCAELLGIEFEDNSFTQYRRTRWNNRKPGNGRYPGYGIIRVFGDKVHVAFKNHHAIHNSKEEVLEWLAGGMVTPPVS